MQITTDTILEFLKKSVAEKAPISASVWLDASLKITILADDESDRLAELEMEIAQDINRIMETNGDISFARAKVMVQGTEKYMEMRKLQAKIKQIEELTRICKKLATLKENQMYN